MAKHNDKTMLVTGATGHQGRAVAHHLRERGFPVRALTRDPDQPSARGLAGNGTEVLRGDLDDMASLRRVLDGVSGAYSVQDSTKGFETEVRQGKNLADAANRVPIDHLVYSSVGSADQNTGIPHFESKFQIENHVRNTGLRYTILRPVFFMENLLQMKPQIEQGTFSMPLSPQTRLQMVAVDDIGAIATMAFEKPGHWENRVLELAGDELSMEQIAEALSRITNVSVQYSQVGWDAFEQRAGKEMTTMFRWFENVGYHADISAVRKERPQLQAFDRWLDLSWPKGETRASGGGARG